MYKNEHYPNVWRLLCWLTFFLVAAQIVYVVLNQSYTEISPVMHYALSLQSLTNNITLLSLVWFGLAHILLYTTFVFVVWHMAISVIDLFDLKAFPAVAVSVFIWMNSALSIFLINIYLVPHSIFSQMHFSHVLLIAMYLSVGVSGTLLINSLVQMILDILQFKKLMRHAALFLLTALTVATLLLAYTKVPTKRVSLATAEHPNIFIIGFDSLRPDYINYFNRSAVQTPHFNNFLSGSVIFSRNYASLAHTSPAWADVLTGQYPIHHKLREDQMLIDLIHVNESLPKRLAEAGYTTIYATDERRHNNIDQRYGFNHVIAPAGGSSDFILSTINDFPLANLIAVTPLGQYIFPYSYANRSADFIYKPDSFINQIKMDLAKTQNNPLFMAAHFNLSSAPYYWFNDHMRYDATEFALYKNAIKADDAIFASFMDLLQQNHYLDHAIVILISDHGVAQGLAGDRITTIENYEGKSQEFNKDIDKSYGNGNDLLSLKQNFNLFAFKSYGLELEKPHVVTARTMLLDIAPTIIDILKLPELTSADGMSLKEYLSDNSADMQKLSKRALYFETGMSSLRAMDENFLQNSFYYVTNRSGIISIYPPLLKLLSTNKQRAILQGDWLLVYYPQNNKLAPNGFVLVNVKNGKWTTELNAFSKNAPVEHLRDQMQNFYGAEMSTYKNFQS